MAATHGARVAEPAVRRTRGSLSLPEVIAEMEELRYAVLAEQADVVRLLLSGVTEKDLHEYSEVANSFPIRRPLLHLAVLKNNTEILELLLDKMVFQILINERDAEYYTPLMRAADVGSVDCVRLLLDAGANALLSVLKNHGDYKGDPKSRPARRKRNTTTGIDRGTTAMHIAAERGHVEVMALLLQRPEVMQSLELLDGEGRTPLMVAAAAGHVHCLSLLLSASPMSAGVADDRGRTVLHAAARAGREVTLRELLRRPELRRIVNNRDDDSMTALAWAVVSGSPGCMSALLDHCADQKAEDQHGNTLLHLACREGHANMLMELLPYSLQLAPHNARLSSSLKSSISGAFSQPEELLEMRHVVKRSGRTAYWWYMKDIKKKNAFGQNCLHLAATSVSAECLELLFLCYAIPGRTDVDSIFCPDIEEVDGHGLTPLYIAARSGSASCVKFLLEHCANLAFVRPVTSHLPIGCARARVVDVIIGTVKDGARIIADVLDECVTVETDRNTGEDIFALDIDLLCPTGQNKMEVTKFLMERSNDREVCEHPLVAAFIHQEWLNRRISMWYRLVSYAVFLVCLTWYVTHPQEPHYVDPLRWILLPVTILVVLFCLPFLLPGHDHWTKRIVNTAVMSLPAVLTLFTCLVNRDAHWRSVTILIAWLSLSLYAGVVPVFGRQCALLQHVVLHVSKYCLVFLYVMIGFSLAFHVLYENNDVGINDFSKVLRFAILVSTRGESYFRNASAGDVIGNYVSRAVHDDRLSSVVTSVLFLLFVVFSLLGVVLLIVIKNGGKFLQNLDTYHRRRHQVKMMHEKIEIDNWVEWLLCWSCKKKKSRSGDRVYYVKAGTAPPDIDDGLWQIVTRREKKYKCVPETSNRRTSLLEESKYNAISILP